jgi:uncharacterized membrane protein
MAMPDAAPSGRFESRWGPTSMGIDPQVAAGIGYLSIPIAGPIVPLIFVIGEKRNRFLRFHAAQALLLCILPFAALAVLVILSVAVGAVAYALGVPAQTNVFGTGLVVAGVVFALLQVFAIICWVWGLVAAFGGRPTRFPLIGGWSERLAGGSVEIATA